MELNEDWLEEALSSIDFSPLDKEEGEQSLSDEAQAYLAEIQAGSLSGYEYGDIFKFEALTQLYKYLISYYYPESYEDISNSKEPITGRFINDVAKDLYNLFELIDFETLRHFRTSANLVNFIVDIARRSTILSTLDPEFNAEIYELGIQGENILIAGKDIGSVVLVKLEFSDDATPEIIFTQIKKLKNGKYAGQNSLRISLMEGFWTMIIDEVNITTRVQKTYLTHNKTTIVLSPNFVDLQIAQNRYSAATNTVKSTGDLVYRFNLATGRYEPFEEYLSENDNNTDDLDYYSSIGIA